MKKNKLIRFARRMKWLFGVYLWPNHECSIMTWNGLLSFYSRDRTLGRSLFVEREFEREMMQKSIRLLKEKKYIVEPEKGIVFDVGGYVGMSSIGFVNAGLFSGGIAFEPNPNNFFLLEKNIVQNKLQENIKAYNVALSDSSDVVKMELSKKNYGDHRIRKEGEVEEGCFDEHKRTTINVESKTLDEFLAGHKEIDTENVKLVWMDIQGSEGKFLRGAKTFFKENLTVPVIMEFTPYAIERTGMDKAGFCGIINELFNNIYILDEDCAVKYDVKDIDSIYDRFNSPTLGTHLVLVNNKA